MLPAIRSQSWPQSTDFAYKTELYAKHIGQGDILPIWSSDDAFGIGSPLPLYYHKTFYYVSGPILVITHSVKASIMLTVAIFMLIGAYGMRIALQKFSNDRVLMLLVPQSLLLTNYTFTNWLVRDDMAEFVALMLIPWLIWWCLTLFIDRRFSLTISGILFLLINAHNVVALFSLIPLGIAYILFLIQEGKNGLTASYKNAAYAVGILFVLLAPMLILEKIFLQNYDPSKVTQAGYQATNNFRPAIEYLHSTGYHWLNAASSHTLQIDYPILVGSLLGITLLAVRVLLSRKTPAVKQNINYTLVLFFCLTLAIFSFLQLRQSSFIYTNLEFMQFIQFPWRLLTYLTVFGIIFVAYLASRDTSRWFVRIFSVIWTVSFVALSPSFMTIQHSYPSHGPFTYNTRTGERPGIGSMIGIGEYLPRVYKDGHELSSLDVSAIYGKKFSSLHESEAVSGGPCLITKQPPKRYESLEIKMTIECSRPADVALPVSYNDFTIITNTATGQVSKYSRQNKSDPRIVLHVPSTRKTSLKIQLPSVVQVARKAL